MIIGMGATFVFLITMVYVMGLLEYAVALLDKYFPQPGQHHAAQDGNKAKLALALAAVKHSLR
jgi:Na+-transporting methylmalonyl-CoA/oxaloacetate decarboxylase gamma subunit